MLPILTLKNVSYKVTWVINVSIINTLGGAISPPGYNLNILCFILCLLKYKRKNNNMLIKWDITIKIAQ